MESQHPAAVRRSIALNFNQKGTEMLLGQKVKDQVTGFEGIVTALAEHITGERRALVSAKAIKDGFMSASRWFDVRRLTVTSTSVLVLRTDPAPKPVKRKKA